MLHLKLGSLAIAGLCLGGLTSGLMAQEETAEVTEEVMQIQMAVDDLSLIHI